MGIFIWELLCEQIKSSILAIGVDHALEQVKRELKSISGETGLSDSAVDKHCDTIPVIKH